MAIIKEKDKHFVWERNACNTPHVLRVATMPRNRNFEALSEKTKNIEIRFVCFGATAHQWARVSSFTRFLDHTQRHTTVSRTPLDE